MKINTPEKSALNSKTKCKTFNFNESQPCHGEGICITQWSYESYHAGPPKTDGSQWRVLTKHGPLEKGMANHSSILAMRTPWTVWKGKKIWHWKMSTAGHKVSKMLLGKSGRELLITPERTKWVGQSGNDTQLWMCLVMKLKSDAVNTILHRKL